ncbi:MAG: sulfite exporter TauE/SafE family protein [Pseudomonadota bacterium]
MSAEYLIYLLAGAAAGGFINGLAGFGTSLFALGWWLQIMEPRAAVAVVLAMSVASGLQGVWVVRRAVEPRRLARFLIPGLVGIPIGLQILERIDATTLKLMVAAFLLVYGVYFTVRRALPALEGDRPVTDMGVGFAGGILGAVAGLSGALPTMWLSLRAWAKEKTRAVLQPYNVVILGLSAVALAFAGAYTWDVVIAMAVAFPATMLAAQGGIWLFARLSDTQFRRLLIALMLISGVVILVREGFGTA